MDRELDRLEDILTNHKSRGGWISRAEAYESNPSYASVQAFVRSKNAPLDDGHQTLTVFPPEDQIGELELRAVEGEESTEAMPRKKAPSVVDTRAADVDDADPMARRAADEEFQAALSDASHEVETQIREVIERVRVEEAQKFSCLREELERQHADDLERARTAVVESFKTLTGIILRQT